MDISIYIATHKKFKAPSIDGYKPIEVGADLRTRHFGYQRDNEGENISGKNSTFCELTAYYGMWKHDKSDIVGLCHYRRYFSSRRIDINEKYFLTTDEVENILAYNDIILPEQFYWKYHDVKSGYTAGAGFEKDLNIIADIIGELFPEYLEEYIKILKEDRASYCNMFITSRKQFDNYCEWLFIILFEAERRIDISEYSNSEKRIYGYISEILLNVWVNKNKLRVYYNPMCFISSNGKKRKILKLFDQYNCTRKITKIINCMDAIY